MILFEKGWSKVMVASRKVGFAVVADGTELQKIHRLPL